jgi:quercetin dioxygenase-like cupin family protein
MKHLILATAFTVAAASLGGCAAHSAAHHDEAHYSAPQHNTAALGGPASRVVELPGVPGPGEPRHVQVLVDEPALKLASIVLRAGTVLPSHHSAVPVTIVALQGSGTVVAGAERLRLDVTHAVVLAPNVPHAVEPDAGTDLVLLVHHLGRGKEQHK